MTTYIVDESGVVQFSRSRALALPVQANAQTMSGAPVRCPSCKILMALRKLRNHTIVAHGHGALPTIDLAWASLNGLTASHAGDATDRRQSAGHASGRINSADADPMDGSRGIGHFAREGGRFGSMPAYDDYGEQGLV
jgi:hypothetical protein